MIFRHVPVITLQCLLCCVLSHLAVSVHILVVSQVWGRHMLHFCLQCWSSDIQRRICQSDDFLYARISLFPTQRIRPSKEEQEEAGSRHSSDVNSPTPRDEDTNMESIYQCSKHSQRTNSETSLASNFSRRKFKQYENWRPG